LPGGQTSTADATDPDGFTYVPRRNIMRGI